MAARAILGVCPSSSRARSATSRRTHHLGRQVIGAIGARGTGHRTRSARTRAGRREVGAAGAAGSGGFCYMASPFTKGTLDPTR